MEEIKTNQNEKEKQEIEKKEKIEGNKNIEENYKIEEKEEIKEKSFFGKKFLIGLGALLSTTAVIIGSKLKNTYDYFTKKKEIYEIGNSAIEFKNNQKDDSIIQKMKSQDKLKAKVIDNTNDKNYIRANSLTYFNTNETTTEYICPITQKIMEEPVITPYGTTYEKSAIIDWIKKNKTDFKTKNLLTEDMLVTNHILNVAIKDYKESLRKNQS